MTTTERGLPPFTAASAELERRVGELEERVAALEGQPGAPPGRPEHPIATPPAQPEHPIVIPPDEIEPPPTDITGLAVTCECEAWSLEFRMADGTDIGDYIAPSGAFVQRCIRVRHPDIPNFFVDFRPDTDSGRIEVVFWNGECFGDVPSGHCNDLPGYTAIITQDGAELHREEVPKQSWGTRWRWYSEPRPLIRDAEAVFADGFLPRMSLAAARIEGYAGVIVPPVPEPLPAYTTFCGPDPVRTDFKCGIQRAIDGGGERQEIGLVTEWQADWLLRGTPTSLDAMMAQAEMFAGDIDFYIPDQTTGGPVNYKQDDDHYWSYTLGREYGPYYRITHREPVNDWYLHEASSHLASLFLVPYALTEDPYYAEAQQYMCQWTLGWDIYGRECVYNDLGLTRPVTGYTGETRTFGWDIRNIAAAYAMSPDDPPSWLLGKSYYLAVSDDMLAISKALFIDNPANKFQVFRLLANDNYWQIFQQSYGIMGMGLADLVGLPGWAEQMDWYFGFFRGVLGGDSGWDHQVPQPHDIVSADLDVHTTWADAMADPKCGQLMKQGATNPNAPSPGNRQGGSMGNCSQIYAACAVAQQRGVADADRMREWMDEFIDHNYPNNSDTSMGIAFYAKCGFDGV